MIWLGPNQKKVCEDFSASCMFLLKTRLSILKKEATNGYPKSALAFGHCAISLPPFFLKAGEKSYQRLKVYFPAAESDRPFDFENQKTSLAGIGFAGDLRFSFADSQAGKSAELLYRKSCYGRVYRYLNQHGRWPRVSDGKDKKTFQRLCLEASPERRLLKRYCL